MSDPTEVSRAVGRLAQYLDWFDKQDHLVIGEDNVAPHVRIILDSHAALVEQVAVVAEAFQEAVRTGKVQVSFEAIVQERDALLAKLASSPCGVDGHRAVDWVTFVQRIEQTCAGPAWVVKDEDYCSVCRSIREAEDRGAKKAWNEARGIFDSDDDSSAPIENTEVRRLIEFAMAARGIPLEEE